MAISDPLDWSLTSGPLPAALFVLGGFAAGYLLRGRRTAPSWVGEYTELKPPRRSVLRLVEGVGMPFAAFSQTIEVAGRDGGSAVTLRLEYEARGAGRLIEPVVLRPRLAKAVRRSLGSIARHFA